MENNENVIQMSFFKRIIYSISKFEKYPEMVALGLKKALFYLAGLILINSIIFTAVYVYYIQRLPEEENQSFSKKMVSQLLLNSEIEDEQIRELTENIENSNSVVLIISLEIGFFISLFITTLIDVLTLSVFGLITSFIAKIKMKYKALFNMSIYAITLSVILRTIYLAIEYLTTFKIKYFDIMYIAISYISLAAAIFIIKSNLIKHQLQLIKIIEDNKDIVNETFTIDKKEEQENPDDKSEEKKDDETEGQSSNA